MCVALFEGVAIPSIPYLFFFPFESDRAGCGGWCFGVEERRYRVGGQSSNHDSDAKSRATGFRKG